MRWFCWFLSQIIIQYCMTVLPFVSLSLFDRHPNSFVKRYPTKPIVEDISPLSSLKQSRCFTFSSSEESKHNLYLSMGRGRNGGIEKEAWRDPSSFLSYQAIWCLCISSQLGQMVLVHHMDLIILVNYWYHSLRNGASLHFYFSRVSRSCMLSFDYHSQFPIHFYS